MGRRTRGRVAAMRERILRIAREDDELDMRVQIRGCEMVLTLREPWEKPRPAGTRESHPSAGRQRSSRAADPHRLPRDGLRDLLRSSAGGCTLTEIADHFGLKPRTLAVLTLEDLLAAGRIHRRGRRYFWGPGPS